MGAREVGKTAPFGRNEQPYRSDGLPGVDTVTTVVDFRSPEEVAKAEDNIPSSVVQSHCAADHKPGNLTSMDVSSAMTEAQLAAMMSDLNRLLVPIRRASSQYRKFFSILRTLRPHRVVPLHGR